MLEQFLDKIFLFVTQPLLGRLLNFDWLVHIFECPNISTTTEGVILCIIIVDVHQFIGHCLIPLDPCVLGRHN